MENKNLNNQVEKVEADPAVKNSSKKKMVKFLVPSIIFTIACGTGEGIESLFFGMIKSALDSGNVATTILGGIFGYVLLALSGIITLTFGIIALVMSIFLIKVNKERKKTLSYPIILTCLDGLLMVGAIVMFVLAFCIPR